MEHIDNYPVYSQLYNVKNKRQLLKFISSLHDTPKTKEVNIIEVDDSVFHRTFFILSKSFPYSWISGNNVIEIEHNYGTLILIKENK